MSYYEENYLEWLTKFSIEKSIGNLFLVKNHLSNTFTIAKNFDINTCTYSGQIFGTVESLEMALKIFERVSNEMNANKKAGALC